MIELMVHYKKRKSRKKKGVIILLFFSVLILILIYLLFFSPLFRIRAVEVLGNREVSTEEIKTNFDYKNIFLFTESKIRDDLIKKFPQILGLEVSRNLIRRIVKLEIKERERLGIVCQVSEQRTVNNEQPIREEVGECFYIDKEGIIFEEALQTSGSLILLIKDYSGRSFGIGQKVFEKELIDFILEARESLFSEIGIKSLDFSISSFPVEELKITTGEGWYILFALERDIRSQILALKVALEEKIQDREGLEYVDLRIENRIYYK